LLGDLAYLLDHASQSQSYDAAGIKEYLREIILARPARSGEPKALRGSDVKAAREHFHVPKGRHLGRSASKPAARREDEKEIASGGEGSGVPNTKLHPDASSQQEIDATDDDDDTIAHEHPRQGGLTKVLSAIKSQAHSDAALEHNEPGAVSVEASSIENTIVIAGPTSPETAPTTPCPPPQSNHNKRDRSLSSTPANPSNKRVCNEVVPSQQPLELAAQTSPVVIDQSNVSPHAVSIVMTILTQLQNDNYNSALVQATDAYHHHLALHVQDVRKQHGDCLMSVQTKTHQINHELQLHQPSLEDHRLAQEHYPQVEAKVEHLRKDKEELVAARKNLDDSKDVLMRVSAENFEGMEKSLVAQWAANANALQEAESELGAAQVRLELTEDAARPALEFMNEAKPQLQEQETTAERLGLYVAHAEFVQLVVRTSPSAIESLDKYLQENGLSLHELRAVIEQGLQPTEVDGQQPDAAMT
jgi:hypothetical protein